MSLMDESRKTTTNDGVSAGLLMVMSRSGITWAVAMRKDSTLKECEAYAYGNTLVFPVWGSEHIFLLAIANGSYRDGQIERYGSGLWVCVPIDEEPSKVFEKADEIAEEFIHRVVFG